MSMSDDFYIEAQIPQDRLSKFLISECHLLPSETDQASISKFYCDDFLCFVHEVSQLGREIIEESFGFTPYWHFSFYLSSIPYHDSHPRMLSTIQLLMIEYDSDCVWLCNGESPQILKRGGRLIIQGEHSPYSHWADYLRKTAEELGLPYDVKVMPVI